MTMKTGKSCRNYGYNDGQNGNFEEGTWNHWRRIWKNAYYDGFINV